MSEDDDDKKLPAIQNRIISAAVEIDQDDPLGIVYQHSLFCQVALPRSRPYLVVFWTSPGPDFQLQIMSV